MLSLTVLLSEVMMSQENSEATLVWVGDNEGGGLLPVHYVPAQVEALQEPRSLYGFNLDSS